MNPVHEQPDRSGDVPRSGQVSTPVPVRKAATSAVSPGRARFPQADGHADAVLPAGATRPGPCPECGQYGPRIVLCHDPDCLHGEAFHAIRADKSRGACSVAIGSEGTRCPCKNFLPRSETS